MTGENLAVRRMTRGDLELAVEWAAAEGWNPGLHDADPFWAADSDGFFVAEVAGRRAGCISAVAYDCGFGFMGFYIVRPELRHLGIGMRLWDTALEYMGNRTIGGDGVVAMLPKYEQCGFRIAHYNARYEGVGASSAKQLPDLDEVPFDHLENYDRRFFPTARSAFLRSWIGRPGISGCAAVAHGRLTGYGVIRPCHTGYKIAPLFADTPDIAETLFCSLFSKAVGKPVFLDVPGCNAAALDLVSRHRMNRVFETARIYKGKPPILPLDNIYGITSFELG